MMRILTAQLPLLLIIGLAGGQALAGPCAQRCKQASEQEVKFCEQVIGGLKANDMARSASTAAAADERGNAQHMPAQDLGRDIASQQADVSKATSACAQAKQRCESICDQEKSKASSVQACQLAGDAGTIPGIKQNSCSGPISKYLADLGKANSDLAKSDKGSENTEKSSGGMPQMPQGGSPAGDTPNSAADSSLNCDLPGYAQLADCTQHFVQKCGSDMQAAQCDAFANRYCNLSAVNSTADLAIPKPLENSKTGEGMGSDFCRSANASRFCQQSGRSDCPSCQMNGGLPSNESLKAAKNSCPTDPVFLDPAIVSQLGESETLASLPSETFDDGTNVKLGQDSVAQGVPGGSGGGADMSTQPGSGGATSAAGGAVGESYLPRLGNLSSGGAGGSGGGYGGGANGSGSDDYQRDPNGKSRQPASQNIEESSQVAALSKEVSKQFGPSVFSISSTTYKGLCQKGRFLHCGK